MSIIKLRRDIAANWTAANPVLTLAEPGLETDTLKVKYGDGVTPWNDLSYSGGNSEVYIDSNPPSTDTTGTFWWDSISGRTFVYYNGGWEDASPPSPGVEGPQGPLGPSGPIGPSGPDRGPVDRLTTGTGLSTKTISINSDGDLLLQNGKLLRTGSNLNNQQFSIQLNRDATGFDTFMFSGDGDNGSQLDFPVPGTYSSIKATGGGITALTAIPSPPTGPATLTFSKIDYPWIASINTITDSITAGNTHGEAGYGITGSYQDLSNPDYWVIESRGFVGGWDAGTSFIFRLAGYYGSIGLYADDSSLQITGDGRTVFPNNTILTPHLTPINLAVENYSSPTVLGVVDENTQTSNVVIATIASYPGISAVDTSWIAKVPGAPFTLTITDVLTTGSQIEITLDLTVFGGEMPPEGITFDFYQTPITYSTSTWTFGTDGNLTLPDGGIIKNYDGSQYGGNANTGNFVFTNDQLTVNDNGNITVVTNDNTWTFGTDANGTPGVLTLPQGSTINDTASAPGFNNGQSVEIKPGGGSNGNQLLRIYPTVPNPDGNHIHITSGDLSVTDLFLGNDDQFVQIATDGKVCIGTYDTSGHFWTFGTNGILTIPGDIHSDAGLSITVGDHPVVADIAVDSIDEYPGTWRLFISDTLYPDLGTTVTAGATVTASWGSEITANVTDNIHDAGAGWWVVMIDQDLRPSFSHLATVTFVGVGKSWEFGTDGTFTLPNGTNIYGDRIFKADAIGGFEFNSFTDNIGGGKKTWDFGTDGSLTLPAGGTISYSPATPSDWNNIAPTTIEHAIDRLAAAIKNLNGTGA